MSKICKKCGKNIPNDDAHFCPECGFSINEITGIADRLRNSEDDWVKNLLWIYLNLQEYHDFFLVVDELQS